MTKNHKDRLPALLALIMPTVFVLFYFVLTPEPPWSRVFYGLSRAFFVLFPILWHMLADKQKFPLPRFKGDGIRMGIVSGLAISLVAIGLYTNFFQFIMQTAEVQEKARQLGFGGKVFFVFAFFIIIANSSLEEYFWRWFGFSKLRAIMSDRKAVYVSGTGFALHHIVILIVFFGWPLGIFFGVSVGVGGLIWCWFYLKYDSIWPGWISHAIIDAAVMLVGFDLLFCR